MISECALALHPALAGARPCWWRADQIQWPDGHWIYPAIEPQWPGYDRSIREFGAWFIAMQLLLAGVCLWLAMPAHKVHAFVGREEALSK